MNLLSLPNELGVYLLIGALLFAMGLWGVVRRRTFIGMLIAVELILGGGSLNFMAFSRFLAPDPSTGYIFTLFVMAIAAAETAIALSIIIAVYRNYKSIDTQDPAQLGG